MYVCHYINVVSDAEILTHIYNLALFGQCTHMNRWSFIDSALDHRSYYHMSSKISAWEYLKDVSPLTSLHYPNHHHHHHHHHHHMNRNRRTHRGLPISLSLSPTLSLSMSLFHCPSPLSLPLSVCVRACVGVYNSKQLSGKYYSAT